MPLGPPRFRERKTLYDSNVKPGMSLGKLITYQNSSVLSVQDLNATGINVSHRIQRCWDNINIPERDANGMRTFRTGGNFTMIDVDVPCNKLYGPVVVSNFGSGVSFGNRKEYQGYFGIPVIANDPALAHYASAGGLSLVNHPLIPTITSGMESGAWNIRPKLEKLSVATALYELRELPGLLKQTGHFLANSWSAATGNFGGLVMQPRSAANDYLAFQFGWRPFLSDVSKLLQTALNASKLIDDISRNNNTWVRRARTLETEESSTKIGEFLGPGLSPSGFTIQQLCRLSSSGPDFYYGTRQLYRDLKRRVWAVGSFKFYRPEFDMNNPEFFKVVNHVRRHLTLFGARINPTHLYQIMPWSWLIDWFTSLGNIIERLDEQYNDGMVAKYLYIMQTKEESWRSIHTIDFWSGARSFEFTRKISTKQRRYADSPYGFVLGGSLNATQWSILGALGLSRGVRFSR